MKFSVSVLHEDSDELLDRQGCASLLEWSVVRELRFEA